MSNVLSEHTRQQVLALGRLGWSLRRIEEATGVRRETASGYLKTAGVPVRGRGGRPPGLAAKTGHHARGVHRPFPRKTGHHGAGVHRPRSARPAGPRAAREHVRALSRADRRGAGAAGATPWPSGKTWSTTTGFRGATPVSVASSPRCATALPSRPVSSSRPPAARKRRSTTARARWSVTRTPASTAARGSSSSPSATPAKRSGSSSGGRARASGPNSTSAPSARLGGTVRVVVLDNLKEGVLTPDVYDPALNPLYRDVLAHYGIVALPCRVGDPDRKGKVESGIGHTAEDAVTGTPLRDARRGPSVSGTAGRRAGPIRASTALPSAKWR